MLGLHEQQSDHNGKSDCYTLKGMNRLQRHKQQYIVGFNYPYADRLNVRSGQDAKIKCLDTINDCFTQKAVRETR